MTENYIDHFFYHVLPNLKIAVIGDIMVDRYVFGKVERISPEAPVPVNKVDHMTSVWAGRPMSHPTWLTWTARSYWAVSSATMKTPTCSTSY